MCPALCHHLSHHSMLLFSPRPSLSKMILLISFLVYLLSSPSCDKGSRAAETERLTHHCMTSSWDCARHSINNLVNEWIMSSIHQINFTLIPIFTFETFPGLTPTSVSRVYHCPSFTFDCSCIAQSLVPKQEDFLSMKVSYWGSACLLTFLTLYHRALCMGKGVIWPRETSCTFPQHPTMRPPPHVVPYLNSSSPLPLPRTFPLV